ncbi:MAG TPA: type II toxin-antitoxin system YhaV family toxin [Longimicrobiaceae bacterium]|jgi:toxin YhaV|nr:type II toxin-antitoxin system YhaV family toxin [Longimicrobiaceae bacterium]
MTRRSKEISSSDRPGEPRSGDAAQELLERNGWRIGIHAQLLLQIEKLGDAAERESREDGPRPASQILASITKLMLDDVPQDPTRAIYRQGNTLGITHKHWFRAKFGNGRYRLFFRFRTSARIIVFAWVNDERSLRTYGSRTDAYATFQRMLDSGSPPDQWETLLEESTAPDAMKRLAQLLIRIRSPK